MNTQPKALLLADVHEDGTELGDSTAAELRRLHFENLEQARLLGMSAEREVALIAKIVAIRNAVAEEREACAKIFDDRDNGIGFYEPHEPAEMIRARGDK